MSKIRKISDLQPTIAFNEFDFFKDYGQSFLTNELGKIHQLIPFITLSKSLILKTLASNSTDEKSTEQGAFNLS